MEDVVTVVDSTIEVVAVMVAEMAIVMEEVVVIAIIPRIVVAEVIIHTIRIITHVRAAAILSCKMVHI